MTTKFEDVFDWSQVALDEDVVSRATHAKDHIRAYAETTQVWNGTNSTIDLGFYAYERNTVEFRYKLERTNPVFFGPAQTMATAALVEYAQVKMPVEAAVGMCAGVLGVLRAHHPEKYAEIAAEFGIKPLGQ